MELLWSSLKKRELANLTGDHLADVAERGCPLSGPGRCRAHSRPGLRVLAGRNREQLGCGRLDLVLLYNLECPRPGDGRALHRAIRDAFAVLEEAAVSGILACLCPPGRCRDESRPVASRWPTSYAVACPDGASAWREVRTARGLLHCAF